MDKQAITIKQHESGWVSFAWLVNRFKYFRKYKPVKKESLKPDKNHWAYTGVGRLKASRSMFGISTREIAKRSGVNEDHISKIENGHFKVDNLRLGTIKKLAIGYDMPLIDFIQLLSK